MVKYECKIKNITLNEYTKKVFFSDILLENSNKNGMWIETQTLRCIIEGGGDVAFINTLHINQYIGKQTKH